MTGINRSALGIHLDFAILIEAKQFWFDSFWKSLQVCLIRWGTFGVALAATLVGSRVAIGMRTWVQPFEVLGVLDLHVAVFDDSQEDLLDDGDNEENEDVAEKLRIEEVDILNSVVGVVESVACLH